MGSAYSLDDHQARGDRCVIEDSERVEVEDTEIVDRLDDLGYVE